MNATEDPVPPTASAAASEAPAHMSSTKGQRPDEKAALEELADDMLEVIRRLNQIEQQQKEILSRVGEVGEVMQAGTSSTSRTVDILRRDLLGERKALAVRQVADAVAPALDSLRAMREGLEANEDARMIAQLQGVIAIIENLLQGMGFVAFSPAKGDSFDPERMESIGYGEGPPGTIVGLVRCGYMAQQILIRPAAVLIGRKAASAAPEEGESMGAS